eukprot:5025022-Amphidinium_carterae.1
MCPRKAAEKRVQGTQPRHYGQGSSVAEARTLSPAREQARHSRRKAREDPSTARGSGKSASNTTQ